MDKFNDPTYLRKKQSSDSPQLSAENANSLESKIQENLQLKQALQSLIDSANQNQQTQEKFYELELYCLESQSYENLLKRILIDLKTKLRLSQVQLLIVDPEQEIQQLTYEIYGKIEYPNLSYVNTTKPIRNIYSGLVKITLSQEETLINQLFSEVKGVSHSAALLPLVRGSQIIGSLHLGSRDKSRFSPALGCNFLQHLASVISVCIENSLNQERFKHLSLVDLLTRVRNRRYFFQTLSKEIARSSRSHNPLSCLFIDIDHFKQVNDERGHLIGDKALRQVAKSIQPLLRPSDVLARFGGEEFTVLLTNTELKQAQTIAERIRGHIATIDIEDDNSHCFKVTISVGVSNWDPEKGELRDVNYIQNQLIQNADKAVYQAKNDGRNCVRIVL